MKPADLYSLLVSKEDALRVRGYRVMRHYDYDRVEDTRTIIFSVALDDDRRLAVQVVRRPGSYSVQCSWEGMPPTAEEIMRLRLML